MWSEMRTTPRTKTLSKIQVVGSFSMGDVFRIPAYSGLLAPLVGSGMQLLFMASGLLLLSCLGVLNPSFRGGFVSVGMGLFVFAGLFSGYFSGRLYKTFGGAAWRKNTLIVGIMLQLFICYC
jgi:Endomembrane protein 70.